MKKNTKILILIAIIVVSLFAFAGCAETDNYYQQIQQEQKEIEDRQATCEHDWVITSEYDYWREQYHTISKCSKCGKIVK